MKKLILLSVFTALVNNTLLSQLHSGIVAGINTTFIKNTDDYEYKPGLGLELGYLWNIYLNEHFDLLVGTTVKGISAYVNGRVDYAGIIHEQKRSAYYLTIPAGINYKINNLVLFGGYRFGYNFVQSNSPLAGSTYDHALFAGAGIMLGHFNLNLNYSATVNNTYGYRYFYDYAKPQVKLEKYNTITFSVFYSFGHDYKK